jgi:hypothetical protein
MAEPESTGEGIQMIRRVLYDLARQPGWKKAGATEPDIINYALARKWPIPSREFEKVIAQLEKHSAVTVSHPWGVAGQTASETRYALTAQGDLEEEHKRRHFLRRLGDELRKPQTSVDLIKLLLGFALGLVSGFLLGRPHG